MHLFLAVNSSKDPALEFTTQLQDYIVSQGVPATVLEAQRDDFGNFHFTFPKTETGVVLVLGGDGTLLQCANDLNLQGLHYPMLGINLGTLGFLTQVEQAEAFQAVDAILAGDYLLEPYPLLSAELHNDRADFCQQAFNDVVVGRQGFARVVSLTVSIDRKLAYEARCDGILVSTALGSTAYNVSLGGPVVPPGTPVFVVTPIAPHLPGLRPIIVPDNAEIAIQLNGGKGGLEREGLVTCDGRNNGLWLESGDQVTIRKHPTGGLLLRLRDGQRDFFSVFREKLLTMK
jgi:NAD+ kinase